MTIAVAVVSEPTESKDILAAWLDPFVDKRTPPTIPNRPTTSKRVKRSIPHNTANTALEMGSAALRVST